MMPDWQMLLLLLLQAELLHLLNAACRSRALVSIVVYKAITQLHQLCSCINVDETHLNCSRTSSLVTPRPAAPSAMASLAQRVSEREKERQDASVRPRGLLLHHNIKRSKTRSKPCLYSCILLRQLSKTDATAMSTPSSAVWQAYKAADGKPYWFNAQTKQSVWEVSSCITYWRSQSR